MNLIKSTAKNWTIGWQSKNKKIGSIKKRGKERRTNKKPKEEDLKEK